MYVGRDDNKHGDAMNFDEAMSEAVLGARVTCDFIGEGVYVAYNFAGWRIHHGDMASSGFAWRDEHKAAEWRIVEIEQPKPKPNVWGRPRIALGEAGVPEPSRSQFYNPKLAEAITSTGQEALRAIEPDRTKRHVIQSGGIVGRQPANVGTAAPLSGFELARLEAAKESEPLPEPSKPASAWAWGKK